MLRRISVFCAVGLSIVAFGTLARSLRAAPPTTTETTESSATLEALNPLAVPGVSEIDQLSRPDCLLTARRSATDLICDGGGSDMSGSLVLATTMCIPERSVQWGDLNSIGGELIRTLSAPGAVIICHKRWPAASASGSDNQSPDSPVTTTDHAAPVATPQSLSQATPVKTDGSSVQAIASTLRMP